MKLIKSIFTTTRALLAVIILVGPTGCSEADETITYGWTDSNDIPNLIAVANRTLLRNDWMIVTNDSSPKMIVCVLRSDNNPDPAPGQLWATATIIYQNRPEIYHYAEQTNTFPGGPAFVFPEHWSTNSWPVLSGHQEIIRVIYKSGGDLFCDVSSWDDGSTTYIHSQSWALASYLQKNAFFIKNKTP